MDIGVGNHPLKGLWIIHNHYGSVPWQSLMDLSENEAHHIDGLTANIGPTFDPVTGRMETYYQRRINVEAWDRAQHMARGGGIESMNPVYAGLTDRQVPCEIGEKGGKICFPAEWIDPKFISITFGESFPNYDKQDSAKSSGISGRSHSAAEFAEVIATGGMPEGFSYSPRRNPGTDFIEVRLYTRNLPSHETVLQSMLHEPEEPAPTRSARHPAAPRVSQAKQAKR